MAKLDLTIESTVPGMHWALGSYKSSRDGSMITASEGVLEGHQTSTGMKYTSFTTRIGQDRHYRYAFEGALTAGNIKRAAAYFVNVLRDNGAIAPEAAANAILEIPLALEAGKKTR